jgi:hypothetical protein
MDGSRFDALSRALATGHSRRALTRVLSALAFSGTLARFGLTESAAKGKHHQRRGQAQGKRPCPPCKKRKKGKCKGLLPDGSACAGGTCQAGTCLSVTCGDGQRACQGVCIPSNQCCIDTDCADLAPRCCRGTCIPSTQCCSETDCPAHSGRICPSGTCVCPPGQEDSGGTCGLRPTCRPSGSAPCDATCCSSTTCTGQTRCSTVFDGGPCHSREDCYNISNHCVGFTCCQPVGQGCYGGALPCCAGLSCVGDVCSAS